MAHRRHAPWLLAACASLFALLALPWPGTASGEAPASDPGAQAEPDPAPGGLQIDAMTLSEDEERYVAPYGPGRAVLTIEPRLQARLERLLSDYRVPWAATVLLEPKTGRVLALAEYARKEDARGLCLKAAAPAASVFKIVTAAALLERGLEPDAAVCYHGGRHRLARDHLADDPRRDRRCTTLASALGHSTNVVFAKLADRGLSAELLRAQAERFLFNAEIPFARPVEISRAEIPDDPFALASTAAGFGPVRLSPLHGAVLAAIVANGGVFVPPELVASVEGALAPVPGEPRRVIDERVALALADMMRTTVTEGTARRLFRERHSPLGEIAVAGKTGSIAERDPYRDYSWFIGFAPVDDPQVAVATVVSNERLWRVKAPYVAREALKAYFAERAPQAHASLAGPLREALR